MPPYVYNWLYTTGYASLCVYQAIYTRVCLSLGVGERVNVVIPVFLGVTERGLMLLMPLRARGWAEVEG